MKPGERPRFLRLAFGGLLDRTLGSDPVHQDLGDYRNEVKSGKDSELVVLNSQY